jgi:hypothetical protein
MRIKRYTILLFFSLLLLGCRPAFNDNISIPQENTTAFTINPTDEIIDLATPYTDAHPLTGLVYKTNDALWKYNHEGEPELLGNCSGNAISSDGNYMLSEIEGDIHVFNTSNCSHANNTSTPNQEEVNPIFWDNQFQLISYVIDPTFSGGTVAIADFNSNILHQFEEKIPNYSSYALSPVDGRIAIFNGATAIIYSIDSTEIVTLDPTSSTGGSNEIVRMDSPAWSPDGTKITWVAKMSSDDLNQEGPMAIIVFDLAANTQSVLFEYIPVGVGGWPPPPAWSPDGAWLIFNTWAADINEMGFWIVSSDGEIQTKINIPEITGMARVFVAQPPFWSPDSEQILISTYVNENYDFLIDANTLESTPIEFPENGIAINWIN